MRELIIFLSFSLLSGCGLISQESFYEGLRTNQRLETDRSTDSSNTLPSYEQYQYEREQLKK